MHNALLKEMKKLEKVCKTLEFNETENLQESLAHFVSAHI